VPRRMNLLIPVALLSAGCNADKVAECVAADLIGQCPVGSKPVLGAQASHGCGGSFDGDLVTESGSVTGIRESVVRGGRRRGRLPWRLRRRVRQ